MDTHTWTHQWWPTRKDLHTSALCRYEMQSGGPTRGNEREREREREREICSIPPLELDNNENSYMQKCNFIFLFFDSDPCKEQENNRREFAFMKESLGVGTASRNWLQPKFLNLYCLKTPTGVVRGVRRIFWSWWFNSQYAMHVFHWTWLILTQYLFSIGHGLQLRIACFLVFTLILSSAGSICQQHPSGSSKVKVMYYTHTHTKRERERNSGNFMLSAWSDHYIYIYIYI